MNRRDLAVRKFEPGDLRKMDIVADEKEEALRLEYFLGLLSRETPSLDNRIFCALATYGGEPLCVGGWLEVEPGIAEIFVIPDKRIFQHKFTFIRTCQIFVRFLEGLEWCQRIQTHSLPVKRIERWMKHLGFLYEAELKRYTEAGKDYKLWGRVKIDGTWGHLQNSEKPD